ncbi:hypothetical protein CDAR_592811 [Caerostris darwini]|uniref:Uncharacterized protein n=1 Tax=Caerostris darwini TaxID=1538125 RepID=A0AAV4QRG1_9ARAC|nr:hypothetical protein CDAR_592811 [Caerostris darwini]
MKKQVTGYSFQGGNSENSQSQMDCIPTFELPQHLQDIIQRRSAFTEHEICKYILGTPLKKRTLNQVPKIHVINSFTSLDQATDMQTDDSPTTQNRMPPVMISIEDQNTKDITNLIGSKFGNRLILKLAPKHLKCTALDNQSYQDLITYLQNNELNFYKTTPKSMRSLKTGDYGFLRNQSLRNPLNHHHQVTAKGKPTVSNLETIHTTNSTQPIMSQTIQEKKISIMPVFTHERNEAEVYLSPSDVFTRMSLILTALGHIPSLLFIHLSGDEDF